MRGTKVLMALLAAGALTLGAGVTLAATGQEKTPEPAKAPAVSKATPTSKKGEKEVAVDRIVRGEVTAVESGAKTLTVKVMRGKKAETIGVDVPDTAKITQGKAAKTLGDIKVGDRVWMKYDRMSNKLVADQIRILKSAPMAAKTESSKKSY
jgi:Cu/Ag efflux protein CusF